jgi:hypothetical protein
MMRRPTWTDPDKDKESQAAASDDSDPEDDGIDRNPCKFPDLLFAIAFSAMVCAMIYAAFYYQYAGRVDFDDIASEDAAGNLFSLLIACYASAAVVSQLVASIALRSGTSALDVLLGAANALTLAGSVMAFIWVGPWTGCALLAVFLVGGAFQVFGRSDRSEFAAATVAVGCDAALEYPEMGCEAAVGLEGGAFIMTVLATLLFGTFAVAAFGYYAFQVQKSDDDDWDTALFLVCLAFAACFFWAQQVLKYVITCATASTASAWWFAKDIAPLSAFGRAVTYHYGAICFGALVVAPIEAIATSINSMKRASARAESGAVSSVLSGCLCCVTTVLQCCESILDYFNKFAFCLVGMRGASYAYASRQIVALFGTQGCIAAGADFYAESVVAVASIGVGAVTAAFAVGLGDDSSELEAGISDTASVIAVLAGAGGYCVAATAFAIVEAAGKAALVLYLEDPNALKRSHETDFDRLSGVWHLLGKEVATVPEEYEPLQAPNDGTDPFT